MLSEPNISYKPFWGICRPLNSWRANSPNPIQIYCAKFSEFGITKFNLVVFTISQWDLVLQLSFFYIFLKTIHFSFLVELI